MNEIEKSQLGGLDAHVAGAVCYVPVMMINYIAPVLFLAMEPKENTTIRFHAFQSLFVTGAWLGSTALSFVVWIGVPIVLLVLGAATGLEEILGLLGALVYILGAFLVLGISIGGLFVHVVLAILTGMEKNPKVPLLGGLAARFSGATF